MVNFLWGQEGHTKYPYFLGYWDIRAKKEHWLRKEWPPINTKPRENTIINRLLIDWKSITLPPLHIKLRLILQFPKHLIILEIVLAIYAQPFLALAIRKKSRIFDGPQIRKFLKEHYYDCR